ncbi:hypothetical protein ABIF65_004347 [Bradyrhizobium japonicum]
MTNDRTSTRPWSPEEEAELLSLFGAGATAEEVGERLRRTYLLSCQIDLATIDL